MTPHKIAADAYEASRHTRRFSVTAWVKQLDHDDLVSLASTWVRDQIEKRERVATLHAERDRERRLTEPPEAPSPDPTLSTVKAASDVTTAALNAIALEVADQVVRHRDSLAVEWTRDLLARQISMPDGSRTTWGDATIAQHAARAQMFEAYAVANVEGAARHRRAIADLAAAECATLNDLTGAVAA